jgi:hypothetical protein
MQMLGPVGYSRLIYILEMNPCMVGNTDWSDRYWHSREVSLSGSTTSSKIRIERDKSVGEVF